ncbi:hypothetical protein A0H81_09004 [Grifola frondosa]|uniref:Uncharacterized protein n=1 Tax=Grifola frondosa TaxID=5627 RepID=A0A1C7M0U0_GRIFR|nr:hypothetical protein A0H81_09004 [Grifola frondosa]
MPPSSSALSQTITAYAEVAKFPPTVQPSTTSDDFDERHIESFCRMAGFDWAITPNAPYIPSPPPQGRHTQCADGRWGPHDWTIHPQKFDPSMPHRAFVYEQEGPEVDPAFVILEDTVTFSTVNYFSRRGRPLPAFVTSLLSMYRSTVEKARFYEKYRNEQIVNETYEVQNAMYNLESVTMTLEKH